MPVTFVKKILANGEPCQKCRDVESRLRDGGHWSRIDRVVIADEADPNSEGMQLAARFNVDRAPFFIVETDGKAVVYLVYLKFLKEFLQAETSKDSAEALLRAHADLGYL